ncbi:hypothetical protein PLICRDRAFT_117097 [Plicaturopsis crispa FD-325 SS-3]|uniref:MutL C-terminal dimerisation domain-containing protein n=1 Tax=Plicaturopsis crispa FD-325 SS-3 TaxID=944288 RepID=A0A0C9SRQ8_PLICR|nr:hypothetical protein PLICRDRAFT_117097 [Plicaturopsis crispa FD-325 SS-3]
MLDVQRSSKGSTAQPEIVRSLHAPHVSLHYNLPRVVSTWRHLHGKLAAESSQPAKPDISNTTANLVSNAGISNADDDEKASEALSRVIDKTDFASMEVLGQFNLGFIVVRQRKTLEGPAAYAMDDLFIIDQHAADEKYNFETLQQTTVIQSQKLLRPRPLEVTAADELLAFENLDVLKKNGFEINADGDAPPGQGRQLQLIAQPVSKGTVFDMRVDLEELIHLMEDRPRGEMVRCSKARSMFASRACRKSVMVGMPLTRNQMATVVQHMGTMDQPWNCPHGRPTMRHLTDIAHYAAPSKSVNWAAFGSTST